MKRALAVAAILIAAAVAVVVVVNATTPKPYEVRAIFDNAGFVIPGEDVKIAGVKVGKIDSLDVTRDFKAAVVLKITQPGYQDFRQDASCQVRPQSLIGERFVECTPTQARQANAPPPPPLQKITRGTGKGQYLLPVQNTSSPVDLDLINDIVRQPEQQRLSLIINELGTGLAGRGGDLNAVIRRADPALQQTDRVLQILASQNRQLQELATNSDTILAPLARDRAHVAGAIRNSNAVAQATAERRGDLEADIHRLPPFLAQLKPTMVRLGSLADEMTPVLSDLHAQAGNINTVIRQLGPFARASQHALACASPCTSLGTVAKAGTPAVVHARPLISQLRRLANVLRPVGAETRAILESLQRTHGIERALDYTFFQATAINGFDGLGHYLRAALIVNQCSNYAVQPVSGCSANFAGASGASASASAASAASGDPVLQRTARALDAALAGQASKTSGGRAARVAATPTPATSAAPPTAAAPAAPASGARPTGGSQAAAPPSTADALMNYLFGKGGG